MDKWFIRLPLLASFLGSIPGASGGEHAVAQKGSSRVLYSNLERAQGLTCPLGSSSSGESASGSGTQGRPKRKALVVLSSAKWLALSSPKPASQLSVGFFLVELAKMLQEFEGDYEFTFVTPDGKAPQLDINGFDLNFHVQGSGAPLWNGLSSLRNSRLHFPNRRVRDFLGVSESVEGIRKKRAVEFKRRFQEVGTALRHLGKLPVSIPLINTNPEARAFREDLVQCLNSVPEKKFLSFKETIERHRAGKEGFNLAQFDFVFTPGGHAPMTDLRDNPELGEIYNIFHENSRLIANICHGPVALTSARFRIDGKGAPVALAEFPLKNTKVTTVSRFEENLMLNLGYVHMPSLGQKTRLSYYVDEHLKRSGFDVSYGSPMVLGLQKAPGYPNVVYDRSKNVLTANGPQSIDKMVEQMKSILAAPQ